MRRTHIVLAACLLLLLALVCKEGLSGGLYLENGIGLRGELEIGQNTNKKEGKWIEDHPTGLKYKVGDDGRIVLIKCDKRGCVADRNITIETSRETLLRRYGEPVREEKMNKDELKDGTLYEYQGIGFGISEDGEVKVIYIFPIITKK